jgi:hypothetical protein
LLGIHRRYHHLGHLFDLVVGQAVAGQVRPQDRLVVRAEGVHADLLADQVARRVDRAAV